MCLILHVNVGCIHSSPNYGEANALTRPRAESWLITTRFSSMGEQTDRMGRLGLTLGVLGVDAWLPREQGAGGNIPDALRRQKVCEPS